MTNFDDKKLIKQVIIKLLLSISTYVLFRNSLVLAHCCLTRDSNSSGVTGRPEPNSLSPSTNLTSENLKKQSTNGDCDEHIFK